MEHRLVPGRADLDDVSYGRPVDHLARTVHEPEPAGPRFTGLLDADGRKLYKVEQRDPAGFVWFR